MDGHMTAHIAGEGAGSDAGDNGGCRDALRDTRAATASHQRPPAALRIWCEAGACFPYQLLVIVSQSVHKGD